MADANENGFPQPANKLVLDSTNLHMQTKKVETVTNVYPGRLVKQGTNDDDIIVCTAGGEALGWAGYEHTPKKYRPATKETIYVTSDQIAVINGPGVVLLACLQSGQTVDKGSRLKAGDNGELSGGTVGTDEIVAIAEQSVASTTAGTRIIVRSLI
jgi:hypothetical protein